MTHLLLIEMGIDNKFTILWTNRHMDSVFQWYCNDVIIFEISASLGEHLKTQQSNITHYQITQQLTQKSITLMSYSVLIKCSLWNKILSLIMFKPQKITVWEWYTNKT